MPLAAEDFDELIDRMGLAGTAAANLEGIMQRLSAATLAEEAAMRVAAGTGQTVAQVKAALAAANKAAEEAERALAAEHKATAQAAEAAAAAAEKLAAERAKAQKSADEAIMAANLNRMKVQDDATEAQRKAGEQAADTSKWFQNLSQNQAAVGSSFGETMAVVESWIPILKEASAVIRFVGESLWSAAEQAVRFTQEKDALRETFSAFTDGGGQALLDGIERLASQLPFTADKLNAWAKSMISAVGSGEALESAVRAVAAATAIMGEAGGAAAQGLIKRFAMMAETGQKVKLDRRIMAQLAEAGVSVKALAAALGVAPEKLGQMSIAADKLGEAMQKALIQNGTKALAVMGNSWASIRAKLTEGWEDAFEDLGDIVGPFMAQLRSLASEFFAGSAAGAGLKGVVRGVLTPAFEIATRTVRAMHIAMLEIEIAYLKAAIALRPLTEALDKVNVSGGIVNVAMYLIAGTAIVLTVIIAALALAVGLVALPFIVAGLAIYGVVRAIIYLVGVISGAISHFDTLKNKVAETGSSIATSIAVTLARAAVTLASFPLMAVQAGINFVSGLVQAITTGQGPVAEAVKALARNALAALTGGGGFDSHSPSRKAHKIGATVPGGLVQSFEEGEGDVEDAAADVATAGLGGLTKPARKGGSGGKGGDRGGFNPTFTNCTFGSMSMQEWRDMMAQWWAEMNAAGPEGAT